VQLIHYTEIQREQTHSVSREGIQLIN